MEIRARDLYAIFYKYYCRVLCALVLVCKALSHLATPHDWWRMSPFGALTLLPLSPGLVKVASCQTAERWTDRQDDRHGEVFEKGLPYIQIITQRLKHPAAVTGVESVWTNQMWRWIEHMYGLDTVLLLHSGIVLVYVRYSTSTEYK